MKGGGENMDHLECVNCAETHDLIQQTEQLKMDQASLSSSKEYCLNSSTSQEDVEKKREEGDEKPEEKKANLFVNLKIREK